MMEDSNIHIRSSILDPLSSILCLPISVLDLSNPIENLCSAVLDPSHAVLGTELRHSPVVL